MNIHITDELKNICLPINPKDSFKSSNFIPKGSKIVITDDVSFFTAWKRKDNKTGSLDLDLGCKVLTKSRIEENLEEKRSIIATEYCDYTAKHVGGLDHSGDFTSCRAFDENNPIITAEYISVETKKFIKDESILFGVHSYNSVNLNDYDVYFGLIKTSDITNKTVNLSKAIVNFQIDSDFLSVYLGSIHFTENEVYAIIVGEAFMNNIPGLHSGRVASSVYAVASKYQDYSFLNMFQLFQNIAKAKYGENCLTDKIENSDLVITSKNIEQFDDKNKRFYFINEHQDEIKKFMNT